MTSKNNFGEVVFDQDDVIDHIMQGGYIQDLRDVTVNDLTWVRSLSLSLENPGLFDTWHEAGDTDLSVQEFDVMHQNIWFMPDEYRDMDIAAHVLALCDTEAKLQRAGQELLMFQERDLFPMLRYLKYLVDTMHDNNMIWGVGRGSSVASYVLYLLGVHRIDSLYYDLDPGEFLR